MLLRVLRPRCARHPPEGTHAPAAGCVPTPSCPFSWRSARPWAGWWPPSTPACPATCGWRRRRRGGRPPGGDGAARVAAGADEHQEQAARQAPSAPRICAAPSLVRGGQQPLPATGSRRVINLLPTVRPPTHVPPPPCTYLHTQIQHNNKQTNRCLSSPFVPPIPSANALAALAAPPIL